MSGISLHKHFSLLSANETNPYLKDPAMRDFLISRSVRTSCGAEGIKASDRVGHMNIPKRTKSGKISKSTKK